MTSVDFHRRRFARAIAGSVALALVLAPVPIAAQQADEDTAEAQTQPNQGPRRQTLSEMIADRQQLQARKTPGKTSGILGAIAGIGVAALCGGFKQGASQQQRGGCVLAGAFAGLAVSALGNSIAKSLQERDQKALLVTASESLRTGEPKTIELPGSNSSATVATANKVEYREREVLVYYDSVRIAELNTFRSIGLPHRATAAARIYDRPDNKARVTGRVAKEGMVHVAGVTNNPDWYIVSQRISEGDNTGLMVVGYMPKSALAEMPRETELPSSPVPATAMSRNMVALLRCDEIQMSVRNNATGKLSKGKSQQCYGPEGEMYSA